MREKKKMLVIIDSNSVLHRAFHALPVLSTKKGEIINAVYGFLLVFLKIIKELGPDYIVACFDFPALTFRHKEYKDYKAKRVKMPDELSRQIPLIKEFLNSFGIEIFEKEGFEADDVIAAIKVKSQKSKIKTIIVSGDNDLLSLVDENTMVYSLKRGVKEVALYNITLVKEKYQGLEPEQLVDFKALKGDSSDNVPGVSGIGEKSALKLIQEFGSLDNLYANLCLVPEKIKIKLLQQKEQAFLSKKLIEIKKDVPIDFELEKCQWKNYNKEKVISFLKKLEFYSLINRLP